MTVAMKELESKTLLSRNDCLKSKSIFLRDYATELYASGATTIRIEKNIGRIVETWGVKADFSVMPTCIIINMWTKDESDSYNISGKIPPDRINFNTISKLSALSWDIAENHLNEYEAGSIFNKIIKEKRMNPWIVLILVGLANASFCNLFGGDAISMAIVFIATVDGFLLKQKLPALGIDYRIVIIIAACLSSLICCSGFVFNLGKTPEIALATSVLYFVPGIPFSNSVCDFIHGHYICGISRFLQAVIITICLSLGLSLTFLILNLKFL